MSYCDECRLEVTQDSQQASDAHVGCGGDNSNSNDNSSSSRNSPSSKPEQPTNSKELPRIPVAMRHPYMIASVRQYRSDAQQLQLQQHIISESFVPVIPYSADRPARKRRRPPFSCSSLIVQAISTSDTGQMTLQDIYKWIIAKYPSLYNAEDTGWQNTIRHNLSLNKCFKKIPKAGSSRGKGGYWTLDPKYLDDNCQGNKSQRTDPKNPASSSSPPSPTPSTSFHKKPSRPIRLQPLSRSPPANPSYISPYCASLLSSSSSSSTTTTTTSSSTATSSASATTVPMKPTDSSTAASLHVMHIQSILN